MKRCKLIPGLLLLAALVTGGCQKENPEPSVFTVSPAASMAEDGYAHDMEIKVTCDKPFKTELSLGAESWVKIASSTKGEKNVTILKLSMGTNDEGSSRKETLTLTAGSKTLLVRLAQRNFNPNISEREITLTYLRPYEVKMTLQTDWTISAPSNSWFTVSPLSGKANTETTLTFKAKKLNDSDTQRSAACTVRMPQANADINVLQDPVVTGDFASTVFGVYNYDGKGTNLTYDELLHQTSLIKKSDSESFNLVWPARSRYFSISGVKTPVTPADSIKLQVSQYWLDQLEEEYELDALVLKTDGNFAWIIDSEGRGYVIKK
ncbi:MAG: BACON domain-containing protein [Bacteroidales bacterium]|nr:BACON domain-containing protein [Bacteroidales bacterium]